MFMSEPVDLKKQKITSSHSTGFPPPPHAQGLSPGKYGIDLTTFITHWERFLKVFKISSKFGQSHLVDIFPVASSVLSVAKPLEIISVNASLIHTFKLWSLSPSYDNHSFIHTLKWSPVTASDHLQIIILSFTPSNDHIRLSSHSHIIPSSSVHSTPSNDHRLREA